MGGRLSNVIHFAKAEAFPDLAQEMGLEILSPEDVGRKASTPSTDEEVKYIIETHTYYQIKLNYQTKLELGFMKLLLKDYFIVYCTGVCPWSSELVSTCGYFNWV